MELNAEKIKRALGCCFINEDCTGCHFWEKDNRRDDCLQQAVKDALALIKELTEENERLQASCTELTQCCTKLETLYKIECKRADTAKADTVRKMQAEIEARCIKGGIYPAFVKSTIDKIAKEMLEDINARLYR